MEEATRMKLQMPGEIECTPQNSSIGIRTKDEPMGAARHRFAMRSVGKPPNLPKLDLVHGEASAGDDAWPGAASPDEHFELSWRLAEGVRLRYGKGAPPPSEHVLLNRKAISAARYAKSDAEYVEQNKPAIRARDRNGYSYTSGVGK